MRGALVVAVLSSLACGEELAERDRGLLAVEVELEAERLGDLFGSTGSGAYLAARVTLGGERFAAQVRAAGGHSLHYVKRSLNVRLEGGVFRGARDYRLSATEADRAMVRTPLAYSVFERLGLPAPRVVAAAVTVNGRFWGLYALIERITPEFFARRDLHAESLYEAKGYARFEPGTSARIEAFFAAQHEPEHYGEIRRVAELVEAASDEVFERAIFEHLDRPSCVLYMAAATLTAHVDGFDKNVTFWAPRFGEPLRLLPWDMDKTWYAPLMSTVGADQEVWRDNRLFARLFAIAEVREEVRLVVAQALAGEDAPERFAARALAASEALARAYGDDPALQAFSRVGELDALIALYGGWGARLLEK